jgi:hypothetical protein
MRIYLGQDLPAPPHPVGLWLSWVIGMGEDHVWFEDRWMVAPGVMSD